MPGKGTLNLKWRYARKHNSVIKDDNIDQEKQDNVRIDNRLRHSHKLRKVDKMLM